MSPSGWGLPAICLAEVSLENIFLTDFEVPANVAFKSSNRVKFSMEIGIHYL